MGNKMRKQETVNSQVPHWHGLTEDSKSHLEELQQNPSKNHTKAAVLQMFPVLAHTRLLNLL